MKTMEEKTVMVKTESKREIVTQVQSRIDKLVEESHLHFPKNYSPSNALQSAWQIIQQTKDANGNPALNVCSKDSITKAMFNTVVQGLNPGKNQVYYIVYKDQLQASRSYFGTMAVLKRLPEVKDIYADIVYKKDVFEVSKKRGSWHIEKHTSAPENIDMDQITAAYCTIELEDGTEYTELMNMEQIKKSWSKSKSKQGDVHRNFPDQMAKRTVINRACKFFVNTSDDSDLIIEAFNATGDHYENEGTTGIKEKKEPERIMSINEEMEAMKKAEAKANAVDIADDEIKAEEENQKSEEVSQDENEQICFDR